MQTGAFTLFMAARPQSGLAALFDNFKFLARQNFCEANLGGLVKSYQILPSAANSFENEKTPDKLTLIRGLGDDAVVLRDFTRFMSFDFVWFNLIEIYSNLPLVNPDFLIVRNF